MSRRKTAKQPRPPPRSREGSRGTADDQRNAPASVVQIIARRAVQNPSMESHADFILLLIVILVGAIGFVALIAYKQQGWLEKRSKSEALRDERRQKMA